MDRKVSGDKGRPVSVQRTSSAGSWTGSEPSPVQSPTHPVPHKVELIKSPVLNPTDSAEDSMVYFTVGAGDEDLELGGEEALDSQNLSKRDIHTLNEQRRRDLIKHGYAQLCEIVPTCHPSPTGAKLSRAAMLQKTIDYIVFLQSQAVRQQQQLEALQREVKALRIMKENYEQIARVHQSVPTPDAPHVPDHVKFLVFQGIADQLFQSFNSSISVTSFETLSSCIISWLEEYCKPQTLREVVIGNLERVNALNVSVVPPPPPSSSLQQSKDAQQ